MDEEKLWLSEEEDEDDQELEASSDPTAFNLPLAHHGGQPGGFHIRNRDGERQRPVVSAFHGGFRKKKPAFNVSCCAKAMIHGSMSATSRKPATLLVYQLKFFSYRGTRIKAGTILFEFKADPKSTRSSGPKVAEVRPSGVFKMEETVQNEASKVGLSLNVGPDIPGVNTGLTISREESESKDATYHTVITGDNPPDPDWGDRFQARFTLAENESQKSGIPSEFTVAVLLERDDDEDFILVPQIEVTADFTTMIASLASTRTPDEPVYFNVDEEPFDQLNGKVKVQLNNLGAVDLDSLWDCTMYNQYGKAVKTGEV